MFPYKENYRNKSMPAHQQKPRRCTARFGSSREAALVYQRMIICRIFLAYKTIFVFSMRFNAGLAPTIFDTKAQLSHKDRFG